MFGSFLSVAIRFVVESNFGSIFVMSRGMLWSLKFPYYFSIGYYVLAFVLLRFVRKYNDERLKGQERAEMESLNH